MLAIISKDARETIEREVGKYLASVSYERGTKRPKAIITTPDGKQEVVFFSRDPGQSDLLNVRADIRSALRKLGAVEREQARRTVRLGGLGEKLLETTAPAHNETLSLPLTQPKEPEPMSNVTPIKTATPEPTVEKAKDPGYTKLSQSEVVQVTRILLLNGTVDDETKTFTFAEGWSDERIASILQAAPGREQVKVSHVSALRKKDFGETPEEKSRRNPSPADVDPVRLGARLSSVETRLDRLERELGLKS